MSAKTKHDAFEEFYTRASNTGPAAGTFFNDKAYLFYTNGNLLDLICMETYLGDDKREKVRVVNSPNKKKGPLGIEYLTKVAYGGDGVGGGRIPALAACVHEGVLYLFYADQRGTLHGMTSQDGTEWSAALTLDERMRMRTDSRFAAVSAGTRLYLIGSDANGKLALNWTDNGGQTWERTEAREQRPGKDGRAEEIRIADVTHTAACSYRDPGGDVRIMVGYIQRSQDTKSVVSRKKETLKTVLLHHEEQAPPRKVNEPHAIAEGESVSHFALAPGSIEKGSAGSVLQLFVSGKTACDIKARRYEYSVSTGVWSAPIVRGWGHMSTPNGHHVDAFQFFIPEDEGHIRSEIWFTQTFDGSGRKKHLGIGRYHSDRLILTDTLTNWANDDHLTFLGVVESPPPHVLNGSELKDSICSFRFKWSKEEQAAVSAKYKFGASLNFSGKVPVVGLGGELKIAYERARSVTSEIKSIKEFSIELYPSSTKKTATHLYIRPNITRHTYKLADWQNQDLGVQLSLFSVSDLSIEARKGKSLSTFPKQPDPNRIENYVQRFTDLPDYTDRQLSFSMPVNWSESMKIEENFIKISKTVTSVSNSVSVECKPAGKAPGDVFSIGVGSSFMYTYEVNVSTQFSSQMGCTVRYPNPRTDEPDDISEVKLLMYVFYPDKNKTDRCYWIPETTKNQYPWCVAWSVDELVKQGSGE
ncbi:hypothetical protein [Paenibacillus sp. UNC499MF]|uniref:hypothetical protein n=1 Tax=Paenibacillus sp. UNC499MF TaxID=1502751 RepID=UPI0008A01B57|nr:hypothetical protein [Paenibacillus sp. UNC499MF]SEG52710.1 hypothetical protein SAMN02799616_03367 [Paenibacillus sp. UNC499MF]